MEKGTSAGEDAVSQRGWIVRFHIGWGGERTILYKGVKDLEGLRGFPRTLFANGGFEPLQY